ncbi:MAG: DUF1993 domain-containing protein [Halieaceae bacterium]|jgi:hypothetical protein|nr:DUF1993 domain-containing protein [Halieaceae bacterium]
MSRLMYNASIQTFSHHLKNLSAMLKKARKNAKQRSIDETVLITARLAPDMLPLAAQVMMACDHAKGAAARLSGLEPPSFKDDQVTFDGLEERIKKTLAFVRTVKVSQLEGSEDKVVPLELPVGKLRFNGGDYLHNWALPNFYFHLTTAYAILRENGVDLGKADFLGRIPGVVASGPIAKMMGLKSEKPAKKPAAKKAPAKKKASKAAPKKRYMAKASNTKPIAGKRPAAKKR